MKQTRKKERLHSRAHTNMQVHKHHRRKHTHAFVNGSGGKVEILIMCQRKWLDILLLLYTPSVSILDISGARHLYIRCSFGFSRYC